MGGLGWLRASRMKRFSAQVAARFLCGFLNISNAKSSNRFVRNSAHIAMRSSGGGTTSEVSIARRMGRLQPSGCPEGGRAPFDMGFSTPRPHHAAFAWWEPRVTAAVRHSSRWSDCRRGWGQSESDVSSTVAQMAMSPEIADERVIPRALVTNHDGLQRSERPPILPQTWYHIGLVPLTSTVLPGSSV